VYHYLALGELKMDPLSALGIAASVAQFIQFGCSLVSKSRQLYHNGALPDYIECESATTRLIELTSSIEDSLNDLEALEKLSTDSEALRVICTNCIKLSKDLLARLDDLRLDDKNKSKKWKSFRQALKSVSSKGRLDRIAGKLAECREELNHHIVISIRYVLVEVLRN